jgi:HAD superfamily hydrolase (TIGR01509 family)
MFSLNTPVVPIVAQLRAAGQRIGILSNTSPAHWEFVTDGRYTLLPGYFAVTALSYQLKALKPERAVYDAAAKLAGTKPRDIFFVDDRPENVEGARAAGFDAVQFTTATQLADDLRKRGIRFNY